MNDAHGPASSRADVAIVGAGAAGLMAAIWTGRTFAARGKSARLLVLDGARTLGAKILVSGGGRCNVTHETVRETDFAGSSRLAIRKVLKRFDVARTVEFFREIGVPLRAEATGKLFPETGRARTVLEALLKAARDAGAEIAHPRRVERIEVSEARGFTVSGTWGSAIAGRVVLASGGMALPKSGSDGHGLQIARALGHSLTPRIFPALVPLSLPEGHFVRSLPGVAAPVRVEVRSSAGRCLASFEGPALCTHFGLSGPAVLDASRHYLEARSGDPGTHLVLGWISGSSPEELEGEMRTSARTARQLLRQRLPERLAVALCRAAGVEPEAPCARLARESRRRLVSAATAMEIPVAGHRGFGAAETTAGGVPLAEVRLETMESRICRGLHLCGEILDVDGRIGGFNFQWAWSSGHVAGVGAAAPANPS